LLVEDEQKHAQMVKLKQRVHKLADLEVWFWDISNFIFRNIKLKNRIVIIAHLQ
jgi:hypothetical protein